MFASVVAEYVPPSRLRPWWEQPDLIKQAWGAGFMVALAVALGMSALRQVRSERYWADF